METTLPKQGDVFCVLPEPHQLEEFKANLFIKTDGVKVVRLDLPAEKLIPEHTAPGELMVQCLAGRIEFTTLDRTQVLEPGSIIYLPARQPHAVLAVLPSAILLTIAQ